MSADCSSFTTAHKDCARCRLRRIQCDRTVPKCRKCFSRNYECPGYGIHLRWDQGVASRGKLTGKSIPVQRDVQTPEIPVRSRGGNDFQDYFLFPSPASNPGSSFDILTSQLLRHFDQGVASKLAWVDCPKNPWRNIILPLSHASRKVLYSVLALASEDLSHKYPPDHPWAFRLQTACGRYRNAALLCLSRELGSLLHTPNPSLCTNQARLVLASVLLLYNLELLTAAAAQWRIHIQCAREVILWKVQTACSSLSGDIVDIFLFYEYYYTSVFIGLTSFDPTDGIQEDVPMGNAITVFSDFMRIIHVVTKAERLKYVNSFSTSEIPRIEHIVSEIEAAKMRMVQLGQTIEFRSLDAQRDFECLVYMYYHASLIYSHRVLSDVTSEQYIRFSRNEILGHALHLSQSTSVAHDLVWPLFIAGSECKGVSHLQNVVEHAMSNIMQISGNLDRSRVLSFLRSFWSLDQELCITWIQFARAKSIHFNFLIIL